MDYVFGLLNEEKEIVNCNITRLKGFLTKHSKQSTYYKKINGDLQSQHGLKTQIEDALKILNEATESEVIVCGADHRTNCSMKRKITICISKDECNYKTNTTKRN